MIWCWERRKPQVPSIKPDPVQIEEDAKPREPMTVKQQKFPDGYRVAVNQLWSGMIVGANLMDRQSRGHIDWYMTKLRTGREQYKSASVISERSFLFSVPWEIIGVIHGLESSFNFDKQILNGQSWKKKTTWVPKGLGPWSSWVNSTVSGLIHERKHNPFPNDWKSVEQVALFLERWNGMGYWNMGQKPSPYLWSYTSSQTRGKYVSDGKYDRRAVSIQVGGMAMLKEIGYFDA